MRKLLICFVTVFLFNPFFSWAGFLEDIEDQSPGIWEISINDNYVPKKGGVKICKLENRIIIGFWLSQKNFDFYNQTFSSGERKPMGFEIDIIDYSGVFDNGRYSIIDDNLPSGVIYYDNHIDDDKNVHTLAINNPTKLEIEKWYYATILFDDHREIYSAKFEIQIQLVGNLDDFRENQGHLYEKYDLLIRTFLTPWLMTNSDDGSVFFNIRKPRSSIFYGELFFREYDRIFWRIGESPESDFEPYYCDFGSDPFDNPDDGDTGGSTEPSDGGTGAGGDGDTGTVNPPPTNPDSDPDLHISRFHIREVGDDEYRHRIEKTLEWGRSCKIEGELKVRNESSRKARDVDSDYRIDGDRNRFDKNDTKVDEDSPFDIDPGEKVTKRMNAVTIRVSDDGKSVKVSGDNSESFPIENGFAKIYFFADVEEDGGDHDISSENDPDEYGVVEITAIIPNYLPRGYVDTVDCSKICGWTKDQNTSKSLEIHVYQMDNLRNNKSFLAAFTANSYRSDLGGNWGFIWYPPSSIKDGRTRILQFYAINVPRGSNPLLTNGEFQFTCYAGVAGKKPVYRLYSTVIKDHFYTISESEKNTVSSYVGWRGEGARWLAFSAQKPETLPMYRLYNGTDHFYTRSLGERDSAVRAGWRYEGIAFYFYASQKDGTIPLYRLYHSANTDHFYTTDKSEKDSAVKIHGYRYEGIEGYVYPLN